MNTSLHCVSLAAFCFHPLSDLAEPGAHRPLVPSKSDMLQPPGEMHLSRQSCAGGKGIPTSQKLVPSLETPAWGVLDVTTTERKALSEAAQELEKQGHRGGGGSRPCSKPSVPGPAAPPSFRSPAFFSFLHPCVSFSCCTKQTKRRKALSWSFSPGHGESWGPKLGRAGRRPNLFWGQPQSHVV